MVEGIIGWLFGLLVLWIGIVVGGVLVASAVKNTALRVVTSLLALASVPAYLAFEMTFTGKKIEEHNARVAEEFKVGTQSNLDAFASYCKGRKQIVYSKAPQKGGTSLLVRIEKSFTGVPTEFNAGQLLAYLEKRTDGCVSSGVNQFEGFYHGAYLAEKKGYEQEIRRYAKCNYASWRNAPEAESRYELVLGQVGTRAPVPWEQGFYWMSQSSVQIVDRLRGHVLAEDTLYFLRYESGEAGCPEALDTLANLIQAVFSNPNQTVTATNVTALKYDP